jgi:hypothetical protein
MTGAITGAEADLIALPRAPDSFVARNAVVFRAGKDRRQNADYWTPGEFDAPCK